MAIVRAAVDAVEVIGLDEAYLDLTGLPAPRAQVRRLARRSRRHRAWVLGRDRTEQARRQGRLRRREAARVRRADREQAAAASRLSAAG